MKRVLWVLAIVLFTVFAFRTVFCTPGLRPLFSNSADALKPPSATPEPSSETPSGETP